MKFLRAIGICGACILVALVAGCGKPDADVGDAAAKSITIWWAQWAPAEGLQELGNEFEKETGIAVNVSQIPWDSYQTKVFMNFANKRTDFDIVVGDSQWIGVGATKGLYLELTDWLPTAVDMDAINERAWRYLCEYPSGSGKYFAAPCETDAIGFAYRKDWFEDPKEKAAFKAKYNRELAVPDTWDEFRDVAEFFHRPDQKRYGCAPLTGRAYDSLTMGFQQIMWTFGGSWGDPETYRADGYVNCEASVESLEFLKELLKFAPKGALNLRYSQTLEVFKNGTTAMVMDYFAFFPEAVDEMGDKAGFFIMPRKGDRRVVSLGGQGFSISAKVPPEQQELAKKFIAWFLQTDIQKKWITKPAGFTANKLILQSEEFRQATPYNEPFAESLEHLQDFWNVPQYSELLSVAQKYVGEALDDVKTPKEALDAIAKEHEKIFAEAGLLKEE
ncbi:MAG: sugar ABC transporter substrate-binding protein [Planctomycetes bacterium]|nr:sugar ABC transporter substrate-binding protein [Planctomycetota bacterium]